MDSDGYFPTLVRHGEEVNIEDPHGLVPRHTFLNVYGEMMLTIARIYHSLPDVRTMTVEEIEFFYDGIREELKANTKPR